MIRERHEPARISLCERGSGQEKNRLTWGFHRSLLVASCERTDLKQPVRDCGRIHRHMNV
jgi:hypothetical protein